MSNTQVGMVYSQIIADVMESSRVDFEEGGVEESVLEELKKGWQQKLSQLQVATFPWDPKPEPQAVTQPPTVPSNASYAVNVAQQPQQHVHQQTSQQQQPQQVYAPQNSNTGPRIKTEPGLDSPNNAHPQFPPAPLMNIPPTANAQQRAAHLLQASYGQRAAASINAIQSGQQPSQQSMQHMQQMQHQQHQAMLQQQRAAAAGMPPQQHQQRPQITQDQYRQAMAAQANAQRMAAQSNLPRAQNDGAGDEVDAVSVIKGVDSDGAEIMGRVEIDGLIRDKIASMGQSMEGGGLMLPLHQATNTKKRSRRVKKQTSAPGQHDGPGSDDEDVKNGLKDEDLDEDAINSDLDDPDDGLNDDEDDDEAMGHIMLCMYDKVQRVKNKWKCVMKDGVLTVNGKEYVFHKASGEYEW